MSPSPHHLLAQTGYEAALAAVLRAGGSARINLLDALSAAAEAFATTDTGISRVEQDQAAADNAQQWELAAVLRTAVDRARTARDATLSAAAATTAMNRPAPVLGQRALKNWAPDEPIWPKRDTVAEALAATALSEEHLELGAKAYRSLFARAWRSCFYPDGSTVPIPPYSDDEGWRWRGFATEIAGRDIAGALALLPADLKPGMWIYNGFGVREVSRVTSTGRARLAGENGAIREVDTFAISFEDLRSDRGVPADRFVIQLPALRRKNPAGAGSASKIDFT